MTYQDLIDQVVNASGEAGSSDYSADALRWLNFTRSEIADRAVWASSLRPGSEITTSAGVTDGIYAINSRHVGVASSWMFDETNSGVVRLDTLSSIEGMDPDLSVTGPPSLFADAGMNTAGVRQVRFYPIPSAAYIVRYVGTLGLVDVSSPLLTSTDDAYFGPILPWGATFAAGMRHYKELDDNENDVAIARSAGRFDRLVKRRVARNTVAVRQSLRMVPVKGSVMGVLGRLDPAHYRNY